MPNLTVDPLAIVALVGFVAVLGVSIGLPIAFWRLSRKKS